MSRKVFVGSLPNGIDELTIRTEFDKYGQVEEIFVKPGCENGRQWAFVTFADQAQAQQCKELCDRVLTFPGSERPCDVMLAKNQGMGGQNPLPGTANYVMPPQAMEGPRKIFVGSLPGDITDAQLRADFAQYGQVEDTYIKQNCEPGRQWAFVSFATGQQAANAKQNTDGILTYPGAPKACEVTLAKNQGLFGQDALAGPGHAGPMAGYAAPMAGYAAPMAGRGMVVAPITTPAQPRKIFVGSLPDSITDAALRAEFNKYGVIIDMYLKTGCEPGRQWAFITFQTPEQANNAKSAADRTLVMPGAEKACEVMLAKNQGKNGEGTLPPAAGVVVQPPAYATAYAQPQMASAPAAYGGAQPPLPMGQPPAHLTPWRTYYTAAGLPYYHNATTAVTQWECPPDLQVPAAPPAPPPAAYTTYGYPPQAGGYRPY